MCSTKVGPSIKTGSKLSAEFINLSNEIFPESERESESEREERERETEICLINYGIEKKDPCFIRFQITRVSTQSCLLCFRKVIVNSNYNFVGKSWVRRTSRFKLFSIFTQFVYQPN